MILWRFISNILETKLKNYLSFGGGVNSVALYLHLIEQGIDFEAVFVNHGTDWPETYEYFAMFQEWIEGKWYPKITVLKPNVQGSDTLYDHCWKYMMIPSFMRRWCTDKFKVSVLHKYFKPPAFEMVGIDADEIRRAKIQNRKGFDMRYPLIEADIGRAECKEIIKKHGLPIPMKSGCYICPFQRVIQWKELRRKHPELFCKAAQLEQRNIDYRIERGKKPIFLNQNSKASLRVIVQEDQTPVFEQDEYPPCRCAL